MKLLVKARLECYPESCCLVSFEIRTQQGQQLAQTRSIYLAIFTLSTVNIAFTRNTVIGRGVLLCLVRWKCFCWLNWLNEHGPWSVWSWKVKNENTKDVLIVLTSDLRLLPKNSCANHYPVIIFWLCAHQRGKHYTPVTHVSTLTLDG